MDRHYWDEYYSKNSEPFLNSPFSEFIISELSKKKSILDIGCGNGRDSIFFAENKLHTMGIDQSEKAVSSLKKYENKFLEFKSTLITDLPYRDFNYGYCRFLLHSINKQSEKYLIKYLENNIKESIFIETRILDKKDKFDFSKMNHYRRIESDDYYLNLFKNSEFKVFYKEVSYDFSKYNNEYNVKDIQHDPLVLRLILKKKSNL
tara:strand:- start:5369 stop:5983 length:615 start_codon:yes stop_codon:yes gene_type:complete